jgi:hypothetical protein
MVELAPEPSEENKLVQGENFIPEVEFSSRFMKLPPAEAAEEKKEEEIV